MTRKLFYDDAYQTSFNSEVVKKEIDDNGRNYIVLKETAFYPTGGGQPHDTGTINGKSVIDVEEVEGELRHYLEGPSTEMEAIVGHIDWIRRFDHMQQHAGQHLLTAVFEDHLGYKTKSFHLGKELSTIDLDTKTLTTEEIQKAEELTNQLILENRPIHTKWIKDTEELLTYTLRKDLAVSENIRLVVIPEIDYNGCGGTHPKSTGEISALKILHIEKQKKLVRVHFVCGKRVLKQLNKKHEIIQKLSSQLSAPQEQLNVAVDRLLQTTKHLEEKVNELTTKTIQFEAKDLLLKAEPLSEQFLVKEVFQDRPIDDLQNLAKDLVTNRSNLIVTLICKQRDNIQIVCARTDDVDINLNKVIKAVLPLIHGKGGGRPSFVQGGGESVLTSDELMKILIETIKSTLT
ncbi:alanyl-tRNA editing protein [Metabacillus halosaccharovorans]|uniref:alanyl-tRNA editing protein n=1 Tax=Metabacillus halosaccharovorans TaxID=930124 RepID=UPI001C1F39CD|nr:DHHA1 domain-containing protein [Metabacillus halosaccharovorans]MBU7591760.1 alanyl-tRNA editing protein [Metabacillus halosaccharovorans]